MLLSVVVVNWNSKDDLAACLASLEAQTHPELEVIVVDNGSSDGSADMVAERFRSVKLRRESENLGFAEGCNRGLELARGEWVAMLNNDAVADPTWAEALVREAERAAPSVGSLQALMLYRDRAGVVNSTGIELQWNGAGRDRDEGRLRQSCNQAAEIFCPTAGAAAYRRSMLERIKLSAGYFDRRYFMYLEDLDLGWRARLAGFSSHFVPNAVVHHVWHGSSHRHGNGWLITKARTNRIRTLLKNASKPMLARIAVSMLGSSLEVLWNARLQAPRALWSALNDGLQGRREVSALATQSRRRVETRWLVPPRWISK